jgi:hypothetical protein
MESERDEEDMWSQERRRGAEGGDERCLILCVCDYVTVTRAAVLVSSLSDSVVSACTVSSV